MALKAGKPSTQKTQKELAIEAVQKIEDIVVQKTKRFNVDIPEQLHRAMKVQAAKEGLQLNAITIKLFQEYLSNSSKD